MKRGKQKCCYSVCLFIVLLASCVQGHSSKSNVDSIPKNNLNFYSNQNNRRSASLFSPISDVNSKNNQHLQQYFKKVFEPIRNRNQQSNTDGNLLKKDEFIRRDQHVRRMDSIHDHFKPRIIPVQANTFSARSLSITNDTKYTTSSEKFQPVMPQARGRKNILPDKKILKRHISSKEQSSTEKSDKSTSAIKRETESGRGKIKHKYKKYMLPLLLAYKLKFFTLIPVMLGGLVLLTGATGMAGFFFALFASVIGLRAGGSH